MSQQRAAPTVLVVEDDADIREAMREVLESRNCHVLHLENGRDALVALHTVKVDLVVLDIGLPVMDGWTFLQHRERDSYLMHIPVLVVTAKRDAKVERDDRIQAHLWKPFTSNQLASVVHELTSA